LGYSPEEAKLEQWMASLGESHYHFKQQQAAEGGFESLAGAGRWLLRLSYGDLVDTYKTWRTATKKKASASHRQVYDTLDSLSSEVVALITCRVVIDQISKKREWSQICMSVGVALQNEDRWVTFKRKYKTHFRKLMGTTKGMEQSRKFSAFRKAMKRHQIPWEPWTSRDKMGAGALMLTLFVDATGLVTIEKRFDATKRIASGKGGGVPRTIKELIPTDRCLKWLKDSHQHHAVSRPLLLPMVDVPIAWEDNEGGGYASDFLVRKGLVKCHRPKFDAFYREHGIPEGVLAAVNKVQATSWEVNEDVYQVMTYYWDAQIDVAEMGLAEEEAIVPFQGDKEGDPRSFKQWKAIAHQTHIRNRNSRATRLQTARMLWMAKEYRTRGAFYYPQMLDFRGRMYPRPFALQPQGDTKAKGLLRFGEGKPLDTKEAAEWFLITGANTWGNDKVTFSDRVDWVAANHKQIMEVFEDPCSCRWWEDADSPWEFLAWALEYGAWQTNPDTFVSKIPVHMDGSNNGLQLYSLLLRDPDNAKATNVSPSETPQDLYQDVADKTWESIKTTDHEYARMWLDYFGDKGIPRKLCKRPVMTLPYGVTRWSCSGHVQSWYEDEHNVTKDHPFGNRYRQSCKWLAYQIWDATLTVTGGAMGCMQWLRSIAKTMSDHGLGVHWTAPSGFQVYQEYTKYNREIVKTSMGVSVAPVRFRDEIPDSIHENQQIQGFPPNFIHSIDASVLCDTVNRCDASHISVVHDSFGTHAADAPDLAQSIREAASDIFQNNLLEDVRSECLLRLPDDITLPPVPDLGDLDVTVVLNSPYFFA
jgi:DNA-directed RNA polymerase, mitochondrial